MTDTTLLDRFVRRSGELYSLPRVAAQVLELTRDEHLDARALKDCIECDPALTGKILRVVNSSLFGLAGEVRDLNQALALLGTKPLKLLVLGFSLPDGLCQMALPRTSWAKKECVVPPGDKAAGCQIEDQTAVHFRIEGEIEIIESFVRIAKSGLLAPAFE